MSNKGTIIGIIVAVIAVAGILTYTNIFELAKPGIQSGIDTTKDVVSKVEGKTVVDAADKVAEKVQNVTSQIEVTNPLSP